jgi:predicted transcriptional regulator
MRSAKATAAELRVLNYIAAHPGLTSVQVAAALSPGCDLDAAANNVKVTVTHLRKKGYIITNYDKAARKHNGYRYEPKAEEAAA